MIYNESAIFYGDANLENAGFCEKMNDVRDLFFSRDPEKWSFYKNKHISAMLGFRKNHLPADELLKIYPQGEELHEELKTHSDIPSDWNPNTHELDPLLAFSAALSKNWEDPASVENVVTMPCDPAIQGAMIGSTANPNLVYSEYAGMAEELERSVVRMMANLSGYDPEEATGVFTQGGTFCNMYGYLFGIRKSLPDALHLGLEHGQDYRIINSQGGHYSNTTNLSVLGVNIDKKTIRIKLTDENDIDLKDLRKQLESCFMLNCVVPTIMLTMGTTDTFGVDRVKPVADLLDELCERHDVAVRPHIHVDAAVGWSMVFFLKYDFDENPLEINEATLAGLYRNVERFKELKYSDSFTVDFQKWGYVPYTSSLIMVKNRSSMDAMQHDPENFSYFESDVQGQTHLQSTIECSRGATGVFAAYNALMMMGVKGYQTTIANCLQNANYFRHKLMYGGNASVIAIHNSGPSVGFRIYDPAVVTDAAAELEYERSYSKSVEYRERVERNNKYHRSIFLARKKKNLYTNWVEFISATSYNDKGEWTKLPGEKAVFMNPLTDRARIDRFVETLHGLIK